ncbi:MAG TPA: methyltransferase domain-containing protein [Humisphaera sp.]|jgi:ubiquinone/menaquinone biosynthesis C-methylase UbiE|nr:methyltransferase domain-containing protein [Humisphaera sp.]
MLDFLSDRQHQPEMLDAPDADPRSLLKSLSYIRIMNRLLGYDRLIVRHLERFSSRWTPGQTIRILDVGTGSADIPLKVLKWAERRGFEVRIVAIDLHAYIVQQAGRAAEGIAKLAVVRADALLLPFGEGAFDYAITSMFIHHLDEAAVARVMQEMSRVARRGIIVSDLLRRRHAYAFITLATLFATKMVRHDARVSVAQAFSEPEILALRDRAGVNYAAYHPYMGHRFVLAGEKDSSANQSG